jgi:hypothetical protein
MEKWHIIIKRTHCIFYDNEGGIILNVWNGSFYYNTRRL